MSTKLLVPSHAGLSSNNFDAIRLAMALLVVWSHCFALYYGSEDSETLSRFTNGHYNSGNLAVLVFFIISGFLVSRSYQTSSTVLRYFSKRVRRIYPGYLVATSICAFVVIPLFSSNALNWSEAFKTISLNLFLKNYFPPSDIFSNNRITAVNGSLWSIPFEFWCYIGLALLGITRLLKIRFVALVIVLVTISIRAWLDLADKKPGGGFLLEIIGWPYTWFSVLPCFMMGVIVYQYRNGLPRSMVILFCLAAGFFAACFIPASNLSQKIASGILFPLVSAYIVFYLAFLPSVFERASEYGDFSYGTYLYAFTIQQLLLDKFKGLSFPTFVVISMLLALIAGIFSWFLIERWFLPRSRLDRSKLQTLPAPPPRQTAVDVK